MSPTTAPVNYRRVVASDVKIGDRIARARSHPFATVTAIERCPTSVWLTLEGRWRIRPAQTATLWLEVS